MGVTTVSHRNYRRETTPLVSKSHGKQAWALKGFPVMCAKRKEDSFRDFVLDQLRSLEGVSCRAMFGGYGLSLGEDFFGIIHDGRLYFKTDETTREKYRDCGMGAFAPSEKQVLKSYYEVPEEIVEDDEELVSWAREASVLARKGKAPARKKR